MTDDALAIFKADVEAFLLEADLPATTLGLRACHDPNLVHDLRAGREPRSRVRAKVKAWIDLYRQNPRAALGELAPAL